MEKNQQNYHDRYDEVSPEMLQALITAHENFLENNVDVDINHPYRQDAQISLIALRAQLEARENV